MHTLDNPNGPWWKPLHSENVIVGRRVSSYYSSAIVSDTTAHYRQTSNFQTVGGVLYEDEA
jgi:hypothetical protein